MNDEHVNEQISWNPNKFNLVHSKFGPPLNPLWARALSQVVRQKMLVRIHPDRLLFKGYAIPDTNIFTSPDVQELRVHKSLISWFIIRDRWLSYTLSRSANPSAGPLAQSNEWKMYLVHISRTLGFEAPDQPAAVGPPPAKRRRVPNRLTAADYQRIFTLTISSVVTDVVYEGRVVKTAAALRARKLFPLLYCALLLTYLNR